MTPRPHRTTIRKGDTVLYYGQEPATVLQTCRTTAVIRTGRETFSTDYCFLTKLRPAEHTSSPQETHPSRPHNTPHR